MTHGCGLRSCELGEGLGRKRRVALRGWSLGVGMGREESQVSGFL